ncbi:MAG: helix-turn-helix domain-containing protein [Corallococcus sp.]|nr:helix-turn-helix domain-containing protein [Corallococcus sp.]MCM1359939.1 helix-turn-helix domain-containing protein [Corallococcus sp.]MCM1395495.1 helix-turn-helix domain-containing protein [Corallococcus sp.]
MNVQNPVETADLEQMKDTIAKNLVAYRKKANLTQQEIAQQLNYSDKAVSKWERAEGVPDVLVLKTLADIYGVTVNDFLVEHETHQVAPTHTGKAKRLLISLLSTGLVWLIATIVTVTWLMVDKTVPVAKYAFVSAWPVSMIVLLVFACIWGKLWHKCGAASLLTWSLCVLIDVSLKSVFNSTLIYIVGAVLQLLIVLWFLLRFFVLKDRKHKKK